jgi:hypothetical protein
MTCLEGALVHTSSHAVPDAVLVTEHCTDTALLSFCRAGYIHTAWILSMLGKNSIRVQLERNSRKEALCLGNHPEVTSSEFPNQESETTYTKV